MGHIKYSVIIPVYNGAHTLLELSKRLHQVIVSLREPAEIIFIDDGSIDSSWAILKQIKVQLPFPVTIIQLDKNYGQHKATFCGICKSKGEVIITMDDDLQHPPEEISKLIAELEQQEADLVYGISETHMPLNRKLSSNFFKWFSKNIFGQPGQWSAFRFIKRSLATTISAYAIAPLNIDQLAWKYAKKVIFIQVNLAKRKQGKSGYTVLKLLRHWVASLLVLMGVTYKADKHFTIKEKIT